MLYNFRYRHQLLFFIQSIILLGCTEPSQESSVPRGVIEGIIESGSYPQVFFTRTIVPDQEGILTDALINWGRVTVSDGEKEVVLTGRVDKDLFPPFRYYSLDMIGEPGKIYTLKADFEDIHIQSSCHMPYPTSIDSIAIQPTDNDSLRGATLHLTSPDDAPAYFYVSMIKADQSISLSPPSFMGTLCTDKPNTRYSIPILRPRQKIDTVQYMAQLKVNEEWVIALNRVTKEVYDFWIAYNNMLMTSNSPFLSGNTNLPTNIISGYGIWSAQGTVRYKFTVK